MACAIVGGGMTARRSALAISCLPAALPVHLIEAQDPPSRHPEVLTIGDRLAAGTCRQLARIGIWQNLAKRATPIQRVHVSDRGHAGFVNLAAADYGLSALGRWLNSTMSASGCLACCARRRASPCTVRRVEAVNRSQDSVASP